MRDAETENRLAPKNDGGGALALVGVFDNAIDAQAQAAGLLESYAAMRRRVEAVGELVATDYDAVGFFFQGNSDRRERWARTVREIFDIKGAIGALNADYWKTVLHQSGVFELMPQARRDEWNEAFEKHTTPDFTADALIPTVERLLAMRPTYLAERIDGIFKGLSHAHITNSPAGFSKRMIISDVVGTFAITNSRRSGLLHDLRGVMAMFLGFDAPSWNHTDRVIKTAFNDHGRWYSVDGGALRVRVYLKGTMHLEVHEDMAWRLNAVMAMLYPQAIPESFRRRPVRATKERVVVTPIERPLPWGVIAAISDTGRSERGRVVSFNRSSDLVEEAIAVLQSLGGVRQPGTLDVRFDFDCGQVIDELVVAGTLPDVRAHQFYPTPAGIAQQLVALANIGPTDCCLEPSAGQGGIADFLPVDRTQCVELSPLHCAVLEAKGFDVVQGDFLVWSRTAPRFDRIIANPPFSKGRAADHLAAAVQLLKPGGRLVAILPASMRNRDLALPAGHSASWCEAIGGTFAGVSIQVAVLTVDAPA